MLKMKSTSDDIQLQQLLMHSTTSSADWLGAKKTLSNACIFKQLCSLHTRTIRRTVWTPIASSTTTTAMSTDMLHQNNLSLLWLIVC